MRDEVSKTKKRCQVPLMVLIAVLTLQSPEATLRLSGGMQSFAKSMLPDASGRWTIDMHWFRTLLHLQLYFLLGCAVGYSLRSFWKAAGLCSVIALADETLKIFLPTREFQAIDLGFDAMGFLTGIGIVFLLRRLRQGHKVII